VTADQAITDAITRAHLRQDHGIRVSSPDFRDLWPWLVLPDGRFSYLTLHELLHCPPDQDLWLVVVL
jgi:hypothetical protein